MSFWQTLKPSAGLIRLSIPGFMALGLLLGASALPGGLLGWADDAPAEITPTPEAAPSVTTAAPIDARHHQGKPPVSRSDFSNLLVPALGFNADLVSEFPVFRDVPLTHPNYNTIETLRERGFLTGNSQGYFSPEAPISRLDAFLSVAKAFQSIPMPLEEANLVLSHYRVKIQLTDTQKIALARLLQEDIIHIERWQAGHWEQTVNLDLEAPLDKEALSSLVERVRQKTTNMATLASRNNDGTMPELPLDLPLNISPTQAIFQEKIAVGETLYFVSTDDVTVSQEVIAGLRPDKDILADLVLLPKGTRFRSRVVERISDNIWVLRLNQAQTPNNYYYRLKALLPILFSGKEEQAFVTPGQIFQVTTQPITSGNKINNLEKILPADLRSTLQNNASE